MGRTMELSEVQEGMREAGNAAKVQTYLWQQKKTKTLSFRFSFSVN